ncbi:MAG: hypothetical protein QHH75_12520 [Bacillota bacterium]|nr:hypothetical protein [Bacillota bacterium]
MKSKVLVVVALLLLGSIFLVGCGGGDKFLGEWVNVNDSSDWAKIIRSGNSYIWEDSDGKYPAVYKDGILRVSVGIGEGYVSFDEKTGHLVASYLGHKEEYKRK